MRLIDADALFIDGSFFNDELDRAERFYSEEQIKNAPTVNPYQIALEDLTQVPMFTGKYDAKNGNKHFMFGILTVLEYIADKAGNEEYSELFIDNMNKSVYGDKAE